MLKFSIVFGYGAVEQTATSWATEAACEEISPRLWRVTCNRTIIGYIAKEPWVIGGVERAGREDWAKHVTSSVSELPAWLPAWLGESNLEEIGDYAYDAQEGWGVRVLSEPRMYSCGCCGTECHDVVSLPIGTSAEEAAAFASLVKSAK